jgi:hypothetical protein
MAIRERLSAQEPGNAGWQRDLYISHDRMARIDEKTGDPGVAIAHYVVAETLMAALVERWPDRPGFARDLANIRDELARLRE